MYLHKKIKKIREKPHHVKERMLIFGMAIVGGIIVVCWVGTFNFRGFDVSGASSLVSGTKTYLSSTSSIFDVPMPAFAGQSISTSTATTTPIISSASTTTIATTTDY